MDIQELIKLLKSKQEEIKINYPKGLTEYAEGKIYGLNIAIRELESAYNEYIKKIQNNITIYLKMKGDLYMDNNIPKKPIHDGYFGFEDYECPNCGASVCETGYNGNVTSRFKFCRHCGQEIAW